MAWQTVEDSYRCRYCDHLYSGRFAVRRHERDCERAWRQRRRFQKYRRTRAAQTAEELEAAGDPFDGFREGDE